MEKVLIIMGSDSDLPKMESCLKELENFGVEFEARVCSAHRTPELAVELASEAETNGFGVIIAAAGLAAHLPGVLAAHTVLPVIGVPVEGGAMKGLDALYAIVQMPGGVPVATVAINGARNAAILAVQILSRGNEELREKLREFKLTMRDEVMAKDRRLQDKLRERKADE